MGITLGLELISRERRVKEASICVNSQPTIKASATTQPGPGRHIVDAFHSRQQQVQRQHPALSLLIRWTPGHYDVEGNEAADKAAREAAEGNTSEKRKLPPYLRKGPLPISKSARRQAFNSKLKKRAVKLWKRSPRHHRVDPLLPDLPNSKFSSSMAKLPRRHTSIITQLATGHIPLAKHLFRFKRVNSPTCPCCREHPETVVHYVLHCPVHKDARTKLMKDITNADERNLAGMLSSHENRIHLLNFVARTQRLHSVFGNVPELIEEE